jgi:hypothetical protein
MLHEHLPHAVQKKPLSRVRMSVVVRSQSRLIALTRAATALVMARRALRLLTLTLLGPRLRCWLRWRLRREGRGEGRGEGGLLTLTLLGLRLRCWLRWRLRREGRGEGGGEGGLLTLRLQMLCCYRSIALSLSQHGSSFMAGSGATPFFITSSATSPPSLPPVPAFVAPLLAPLPTASRH